MTPPGPTLVIADGNLPGLLACAATSEATVGGAKPRSGAKVVSAAWIPHLATHVEHAARAQADLYELRVMQELGPGPGNVEVIPKSSLSAALLAAAAIAAAEGLEYVLWPVHSGEDLELARVAEGVDRAALVTRLASLDAAGAGLRPVEVRAPYADFTDAQIADLALDMDLPLRTCWWWEGRDEEARRERQRWGRALTTAGWKPPESWGSAGVVNVRTGAGAEATRRS